MKELLKKLKDFANEHNLLPLSSKIGVAVSGGPDSVFLLTILNAIKRDFNLDITVLHFNHNIRIEASKEEQFVKEVAKNLNLNIFTGSENVMELSQKQKLSLEHAARIKRYEFFNKARRVMNLDFIATGHTMNDFTETFLINLIRGSSLDGLVSLKPKRDFFIRPILIFTKDEILEFLRANNIEFKTDKSNYDTKFIRNKIRLELIDKLKELNPSIIETIFREGMLILKDVKYMKNKTEINIVKSVKFSKNKAIFDITQSNQNTNIIGRTLSTAVKKLLNSDYSLSSKNIKRLEETVKFGKTTHLRGKIKAKKLYNKIIIEKYEN